LQAIKFLINIS